MQKNVGSIDKILRLILAVGLFSLFFILEGNARYWALVGIIPLITGLMNSCPVWSVFGINTARVKVEKYKS
ncbi:MAG: DUF2892 domain-containing protein [Candidatus Marinimicrobia bacterium]|jgi:hypothetical protein|nr:DUF2892 domain-containing protein [Candidatus Neomarinimicrobiota bacterium]MBT3576212.1 DUF2892 domain-containing protein [Candidatus Neomarinimicrobiota bacterium]MBT3679247.1 DUF2892 domain-containing protein [Candidatus Neomarinimicrobiota bacterium]MBT3949741.1 DUF2892 domain-containing protein [Candidatus Neomarinimicrobiota bacterium]MBT4254073.1 DUF2892 domain-containing protein [Candidatus Neomarinimicrobiota bacterium]